MRVVRSRTLKAPVAAVWAIVADPYELPHWWPLVRHVEGVRADRWTTVLGKPGGRGVRADQQLEACEHERLLRWSLVVPGSPFERVVSASQTEARLERAGEGTELTLQLDQRPRGWSRLGWPLLRRAGGRQLGEALDGMARLVER